MKTLAAAVVVSGLGVAAAIETTHARDPEVVARIAAPEFPSAVLADPIRGRTIAIGGSLASVIDTERRTVVDLAPLPDPTTWPFDAAQDPVSGRTVIAHSHSVMILEGAFVEHLLRFDERIQDTVIDPFSGRLFVATGTGPIQVFDIMTGRPLSSLGGLPPPYLDPLLAIDALSGEVLALSRGRIFVFPPGASSPSRSFLVSAKEDRFSNLAIDPLARRIYLTREDGYQSYGNAILIVDADSGEPTSVVSTPECSSCRDCRYAPCQYSVSVDALSDRAWVTAYSGSLVQQFEGGLPARRMRTATFPLSFSLNPFTSRALIGLEAYPWQSQILDAASLEEIARVDAIGSSASIDPLRDEWYASGYSDTGPTVDVVAGFNPVRARFVGEMATFLTRIPRSEEGIYAPLQTALSVLSDTDPNNDAEVGRLIGVVLMKVERGNTGTLPTGLRQEVRDAARRLAMTYLAAAGYAP